MESDWRQTEEWEPVCVWRRDFRESQGWLCLFLRTDLMSLPCRIWSSELKFSKQKPDFWLLWQALGPLASHLKVNCKGVYENWTFSFPLLCVKQKVGDRGLSLVVRLLSPLLSLLVLEKSCTVIYGLQLLEDMSVFLEHFIYFYHLHLNSPYKETALCRNE